VTDVGLRTDVRTERIAISISRVSALMRDNKTIGLQYERLKLCSQTTIIIETWQVVLYEFFEMSDNFTVP